MAFHTDEASKVANTNLGMVFFPMPNSLILNGSCYPSGTLGANNSAN